MGRTWFRHEDSLRNDDAINELVDDFGPLGDLVFRRLLEVRSQEGKDIVASTEELARMLNLRPSWRFPLDRWVVAASKLKLISVRRGRKNRRIIRIFKWDDYQPEWVTREAAAERKRRSRARQSQESHSDSHSDKTVTSHTTNVTNERDVTDGVGLPSARRAKLGLEKVSNDESESAVANGNGSVQAHEAEPNGEVDAITDISAETRAMLAEAKAKISPRSSTR